MSTDAPHLIIIAGPNGAGKSTTAPLLLHDTLAVDEYVNADDIARGLSAFAPEKAALEAGKIMLKRLRWLAEKRLNFAFETTLASRSFAPWIARLRREDYRVHLVFLSLPETKMAVERVAVRVRLGGHHIPDDVVMRRFHGGLRNLFRLYMPILSSWEILDNSNPCGPVLIAKKGEDSAIAVRHRECFDSLRRHYAEPG